MGIRAAKKILALLMILLSMLCFFSGTVFVQTAFASEATAAISLPTPQKVFQLGDSVEIIGTAQWEEYVTITVRNEAGGLAFLAQPQVENGVFNASFILPSDASKGTYTIKLGAQGLESPIICSFVVGENSTGPGATEPPNTVLIVKGEGVDRTYYFTLDDLKNKKSGFVEDSYYSLNNVGTKAYFDFAGISLAYLLDEMVVLNNKALSVTIKAETDNYYRNYNLDGDGDISGVRDNYIDENDPGKKLAMILAWEENGKRIDGKYPLKLVMGQTKPGDVNKQHWVSNVKTIIVNNETATDPGPKGPGAKEETPGAIVLDVTDKTQKETITTSDGRKGEKLTLNDSVISSLNSSAQGTVVRLTSSSDVDVVQAEISGAVLSAAKEKNNVFEFEGLFGTYYLPTSAISLDSVAAQLGVNINALTVNIVMSKVSDQANNDMISSLEQGQSFVGIPVEFTVEFTAGDKKYKLTSFGSTYIERHIPVGSSLNPNETTGAIWDEEDGQYEPVPTRFETRDGKTFAVILRRTNSIYAVIQQKKTFYDIQNSWAKKEIELLASKMIIKGKSADRFMPASNITRAEFSALLVRALGLEPEKLEARRFKDVKGSEWFAGSVAVAVKEGIVTGYQDGTFGSEKNITRQEIAMMIARAAKAAGKENLLTASDVTQGLQVFSDKGSIPGWAEKDVAFVVKAGIITGMPGGKFSPGTNADRAQSAVMLKRFLTYVNFISTN